MTALVAAQSEMKNASLNKTNPHFKSRYADLAEIRDTVMPVLSKNGLALIQYTNVNDVGFFLITRLMHISGEFIEGRYPLPENMDKPQSLGSAITYARRYMMAAICGITAEEDDDGNAAQNTHDRGPTKIAGYASSGRQPAKPSREEDGVFI